MKMKMRLIPMVALMASIPSLASAAVIASLDFTGGGSAWSVIVNDGGLPLVYELDDDPTNVGIPNWTGATGQYNLSQQVFAPVGFTMSNIRVEAKASGYSSWLMDGRIGFSDEFASFALQHDYATSVSQAFGGSYRVDQPFVLDSTGDLAYVGLTSIYVGVEIVKGLASVWTENNVREIKVFADLTPVPEPASMALVLVGAGCLMFGRSRKWPVHG